MDNISLLNMLRFNIVTMTAFLLRRKFHFLEFDNVPKDLIIQGYNLPYHVNLRETLKMSVTLSVRISI